MTIEDRLENMERELGLVKRRNRWLLGAILLVAGGLIVPAVFETTVFRAWAQGSGTAKEIRARSIFIEDENGTARVALSAGKDLSGLMLWDENGKLRAGLSTTKDGPRLELFDENGNTSAKLAALTDGLGLWLWDQKKGCAVLGKTKDGTLLSLCDGNGKPRAGLSTTKDGPSLELYDENGNGRFMAGIITMISPEGKTVAYPESSLILFGPDGKIIWSAIK
jgi:hypothetical protein